MIDARELRIGNIVYVDNEKYHPKLKNIPLEVSGISECIGLDNEKTYSIGLKHINHNPNTYYETYSQFIKFIKPVELTEDLLLKCGFVKKDNYCFYYNGIRLIPIRDLYLRGNFPIRADIKYLHQLQNLYYALTGQELEINL